MNAPKLFACALAALFVVSPGQSFADETGLAGMHAQAVTGKHLCFTDHTHVGTGTPQSTKRQAVAAAAQDWMAFTAFEYGSDWASWRLATAKSTECQAGPGNWTCEVQARPCRAGRAVSRQARR